MRIRIPAKTIVVIFPILLLYYGTRHWRIYRGRRTKRMIIDARVRPPFKSLKEVLAPAPGARPSVKRSPLVSGYERPQSMVQKSVELFLQEMDDAGVDKGILVGRQAGHRVVANDDIAEIRDQYPARFPLAMVGINGIDVPAAIREVERTITRMGFNGIAVDPGWWVPPMYVDDPRIYPVYAKCQELGEIGRAHV